jgi:hypothetical protein
MERRTWLDSLRGVKIYIFILTVSSLSLVGSLIHSQPAGAESFLGKTVRCVVGGLLLGADCRTPVEQAPAVPPATEPQPTDMPTTPNSNTTSSSQSTPQPARVEAAQLTPIEDIEIVVETSELPALPFVMHRNSEQPKLPGFATVNNIPGSGTLGVSTTAFEPSREGWRIFGIPWYRFGAVAIAIFTAGIWAKKRYTHTA